MENATMRFARTLMVCMVLALQPLAASAASMEQAVTELQHEWELTVPTPEKEQEKKYEALAAKAHQASLAS
jgi:hypothetical protein